MKKKLVLVSALVCTVALLAACGKDKAAESTTLFETVGNETETQQEVESAPEAQENAETATATETESSQSALTEDQAYTAVINYNKAIGSGIDDELNTDGYEEYWDVSTNEDGTIVVLYRSYTAAQIRYYVDPVSGDAYVTELVPGIIDEEQKNGETFNARDYLTATLSAQ